MMQTTHRGAALCSFLAALCFAAAGNGQQRPRTIAPQTSTVVEDPADEVVRVNTRAVFIDTLVKDKRTGAPVEGLKREDFEVLDNGRPRAITYFSAEAAADKRPLALLLVLAPLDDGAANSLQQPTVVSSLAKALAQLPSQDEVALMLVWRHGTSHMLADLTSDQTKVTSALTTLPKRDNAKSNIRPPKVIQEAALAIASQRPQSQMRVVLITDSVFLISHAEQEEIIRNLIKANITFNALITATDKFFVALSPLLIAANNDLDELFDVPQYVAKQTGGEYVRVSQKRDYGPALEKLLGTMTARYNLGFTPSGDEAHDGRMHRLEVRVKARDVNGDQRRFDVSARQGYYLPAK
jgi:Ca-activated chloride channel homolog